MLREWQHIIKSYVVIMKVSGVGACINLTQSVFVYIPYFRVYNPQQRKCMFKFCKGRRMTCTFV